MVRKIGSMFIATTLLIGTLSGCGTKSVLGSDATSYPLVDPLTKQEVLDYYAKSLDYDTVVSRNTEIDINNYETTDVNNQAKVELLKSALTKTESLLKQPTYTNSPVNNQYLNESTYHYIKAMLNDKKISNPNIVSMKQALGYYFIDVEYDISGAEIGTFKPSATLLGMSGSFKHSDYFNTDSVNKAYMLNAVTKLNDYYKANNVDKRASFNENTLQFTITTSDSQGQVDFNNSTVNDPIPNDITDPDTAPVDGEATDGEGETTPEPITIPVSQSVINSRKTGIDLSEFNSVVGYSNESAYIPALDMFYNVPQQSTDIQGIGLFPSGDGGLKIFGMNRGSLAGKLTMRYVYKENLTNPSEINCENIYTIYYEITSGYSANNDNIIPEFLTQDFEIIIERADRAMANDDTSGLLSGNIFSDIGVGALRGYEEKYSNLLRQTSTLRRIISRDIENNAYLVELETYREEGPASADVYSSYKDKVYAVIEQNGSSFIITDYMIMTRQLTKEPEINPDDATAKRIVSLGLTGEVSESTKTGVQDLLDELYQASSLRILRGPKEVTVGTEQVNIKKGMYDCFNSNVEMLSSSKLEELNSRIRSLLVKYGTNVAAEMNGTVTEWIGGTDNQVEFTTEEVITYQGRNDGVYMTCYYLVSSMEDVWVIDDIQILDQQELSGDGLQAVVNRIG